jgi:hypothetical protein
MAKTRWRRVDIMATRGGVILLGAGTLEHVGWLRDIGFALVLLAIGVDVVRAIGRRTRGRLTGPPSDS